MILDIHKEYLPSFGFGEYQQPVCIVTVLCLGGSGRDCAAYQGVLPRVNDTLLDELRKGGTKISEPEARNIFGDFDGGFEHEGQPLTYRR